MIFDAPHPYLDRLLEEKRVRVNDVLQKLRVLSSVYQVNIDTYARQGKPEWRHLSGIARDLETDPLFLFSYLRAQQRRDSRDSLRANDAEQYLHIYEKILEEDLGKIQRCVDLYTVFYRGGYQSHSILKPVDIVAKAIINSPLDIDEEDLLWQIQGELKNWLDRVRGRQATACAVARRQAMQSSGAGMLTLKKLRQCVSSSGTFTMKSSRTTARVSEAYCAAGSTASRMAARPITSTSGICSASRSMNKKQRAHL